MTLLSSNFSQTHQSPRVFYRHDLISQLQHNHALVTLVAENLAAYMNSIRLYARGMYSKLKLTIES
jgi:ubiquitin carboxyl-terminal hydrolase 9/24